HTPVLSGCLSCKKASFSLSLAQALPYHTQRTDTSGRHPLNDLLSQGPLDKGFSHSLGNTEHSGLRLTGDFTSTTWERGQASSCDGDYVSLPSQRLCRPKPLELTCRLGRTACPIERSDAYRGDGIENHIRQEGNGTCPGRSKHRKTLGGGDDRTIRHAQLKSNVTEGPRSFSSQTLNEGLGSITPVSLNSLQSDICRG